MKTNKAGTKINQRTGKVKFRHSTLKDDRPKIPDGCWKPQNCQDCFKKIDRCAYDMT